MLMSVNVDARGGSQGQLYKGVELSYADTSDLDHRQNAVKVKAEQQNCFRCVNTVTRRLLPVVHDLKTKST